MTAATLTFAARDCRTMLGRNLVRLRRYPSLTVLLVGMPVVLLLLFVYVFGGTLGAGLPGTGGGGGRREYVNYVTPGILLIAVASAAQGSAITVAMDMTEGVIGRFRTMAIFRPSVLTGHVVATLLQSVIGLALVLAVAFAVGFRSEAGADAWLAAIGVLAMVTFALTWLCVGLGLRAKTVESASNTPMVLTFLPFLGSGFVPTESMPAGLRWFAAHQPFTPIMDTLRGLLLGGPIGSSALVAALWCAGITGVCFVWACSAFDRDPKAAA